MEKNIDLINTSNESSYFNLASDKRLFFSSYQKFTKIDHIVSLCQNERVTGRKARGPQTARGNKLQVADFFFFPFSVDETGSA